VTAHARPAVLACAVLAWAALAASCVGGPKPVTGTAISGGHGGVSEAQAARNGIEALIAMGSPSSLELAASTAAESATLPPGEAASYAWIAWELARLAYPEAMAARPALAGSPPDTALVRAFVDARNGRSGTAPAQADASPLFELFPVLGVFRLKTAAVNGAALAAAERFASYALPSALSDLARAMALERGGDKAGALDWYRHSLSLAPDCYPAALGASRLLSDSGRAAEALDTLALISPSLHASSVYRRAHAMALYGAGRWTEAFPLVTAVLLDDPMDSRFMLIRAHLLVERGEYRQATPLLDAYASVDSWDRLYLLLRARVALESAKDRGTAVAALRRGLERYPEDRELVLYAAETFWSGDLQERAEAVVLASRVLKADPASERALRLLLAADLASGDAAAAAVRADAIRTAIPGYADYGSLYRAYRGAGRLADAAAMAKAWLAAEPASEQANLAWAGILVDRGDKAAASELIGRLLAGKGGAAYRSSLYFLQSRLQPNDDAALASLRSALVENGMNLEALVATYDIYFRKNDLQRARFYLKQALTIAPERQDLADRRTTLAQLGVAIP